MKKIAGLFLAFACTLTLASCQGKTSIVIPNENGENVEVMLQKTDDVETIATAMCFVSNASYEDVASVTMSNLTDVKLRLDSKNNLSGKASTSFSIDKDTNMALALDVAFKSQNKGVKEDNKIKANLNVADIYNDPNIYIDYDVKLGENIEKKKTKFNIDDLSKDLIILLEGILSSIPELPELPAIPSLPSVPGLTALNTDTTVPSEIPTPSIDIFTKEEALEAIEEFKKSFPNTVFELDNVKKNSFDFVFKLSLKDLINFAYSETTIEVELPKEDVTIYSSLKVDTKSARVVESTFEMGGKDLTPYLELFLKDIVELDKPSFNIKFNTSIDYFTESKVEKLSDSKKAEYKQFVFPTLPF